MYVHCGTVHNRKDLELTHIPVNDRLDKENVAHIHLGLICSHKRNVFMSFAGTWMKLETIILSKLTQEENTKNYMFSLHTWELNNKNTWTQVRKYHPPGPVRGGGLGEG